VVLPQAKIRKTFSLALWILHKKRSIKIVSIGEYKRSAGF